MCSEGLKSLRRETNELSTVIICFLVYRVCLEWGSNRAWYSYWEIRLPGYKVIQNLQSRVLGIKQLCSARAPEFFVGESVESLAGYLAVCVQNETPWDQANYQEKRKKTPESSKTVQFIELTQGWMIKFRSTSLRVKRSLKTLSI